jgi:hypothetical protein
MARQKSPKRYTRACPRTGLLRLSLAALGVVFGDIGTSSLYAVRECFQGRYGIAVLLLLRFWVGACLFAIGACAGAWASDELLNPPPGEAENRHDQTVIDLQPLRKTTFISIRNRAGENGTALLINLNPQINTWFVLALQWPTSGAAIFYHLENPLPESGTIGLDPHFPMGLVLDGDKKKDKCLLWDEPDGGAIARAASSGAPFSPLCGGRLGLRNATEGHKTNLEAVTDLLRQHVWQGEKITAFVRETFFKDAFLNTATEIPPQNPWPANPQGPVLHHCPRWTLPTAAIFWNPPNWESPWRAKPAII